MSLRYFWALDVVDLISEFALTLLEAATSSSSCFILFWSTSAKGRQFAGANLGTFRLQLGKFIASAISKVCGEIRATLLPPANCPASSPAATENRYAFLVHLSKSFSIPHSPVRPLQWLLLYLLWSWRYSSHYSRRESIGKIQKSESSAVLRYAGWLV